MADLGTTGFADLSPMWAKQGVNGVVLGHDDGNQAHGCVWPLLSYQGHALTFGATRSGKGVSAIIPALLTYGGSMVVIDPKSENAWGTIPRRRALGQRVVLVDPWDELRRRYAGGAEVEPVTRFNPLAALDPASDDFGDDVAAIADALITHTGGDSHWSDSARELVAGLVAAYVEARPGKASLRDVRRALLLSQDDFGQLVAFFEETTPNGLGCRKLAGFKISSREVDSIRSAAKTQTAFLDSEKLCDSLDGQDQPFDLAELATGRVTLYLVLPLNRLQTHGRWLRLILTLAIAAIVRQPRPPPLPVLLMLDEMGTIGRLSMIEQAFGLMSGVGVRIWGFLQDLNQLKRDYPESWETFIANCAVMQMLNARDATTSNYFSDFLGTNAVLQRSQLNHERALKDPVQGAAGYMSDRIDREPVMPAADLRQLSPNKQILFFMGMRNMIQTRFKYYETPGFDGMWRALPGFALKRRIVVQSFDQATAKLKTDGYQIKTRMMGGMIVTGPDGKVSNVNETELIAMAQHLFDAA